MSGSGTVVGRFLFFFRFVKLLKISQELIICAKILINLRIQLTTMA
jgi:hypothetical protein